MMNISQITYFFIKFLKLFVLVNLCRKKVIVNQWITFLKLIQNPTINIQCVQSNSIVLVFIHSVDNIFANMFNDTIIISEETVVKQLDDNYNYEFQNLHLHVK